MSFAAVPAPDVLLQLLLELQQHAGGAHAVDASVQVQEPLPLMLPAVAPVVGVHAGAAAPAAGAATPAAASLAAAAVQLLPHLQAPATPSAAAPAAAAAAAAAVDGWPSGVLASRWQEAAAAVLVMVSFPLVVVLFHQELEVAASKMEEQEGQWVAADTHCLA